MKLCKKILFPVLSLLFALGIACFAAACGGGREKQNCVFAVTVACEDADALGSVEVSLKTEDGEAVENGGPKALTGGKATFELPSATYKVVLSGVPEGYLWDPAWVSEQNPNATVTLVPGVQKVEYVVTAVDEAGAPLAGALFSLLNESGETVASAETKESGKAIIKALPASYTLRADLAPEGYTVTAFEGTMSESAPSKTVTFHALDKVAAFDEAFRGSWRAIGKEVALLINSTSLNFNSERLNAYAGEDGAILFWAGSDVYTLAPYEGLEGALTLTLGDETLPLLPEKGLAYVAVPSTLEGTWTIADEEGGVLFTILLNGSTFTLGGTDGYITLYEDGEETARLIGIIETGEGGGVYFMTYDKNTGGLSVPGFEVPFFKSGAGTSADPEVLGALAGDYSYTLLATGQLAGGFSELWMYASVYLTYTAGSSDETYTLIVTNYDLIFEVARADADENDTHAVLLNWDKMGASSNYASFTLKANTQYNITISNSKTSTSELPPCKMTFSIHEGVEKAPAKHSVPASFHGIWYNKADDNDRLVITEGAMRWEDDTIVWGGKAMQLISAAGNVLTASLDGKTWTFTREEAVLTGTCGQETAVFSLLSKNPKSAPIPGVYSGLWICENAPSGKTEYLYIVAFTATGIWPEIEYLDNGAFYWMGRAAVVTEASLFGLTIVMDDLVWEGRYDSTAVGATLTITREGESYVFSAPSRYATDFSALLGDWAADGYQVHITKDTFIFNGVVLAGTDGSVDEFGDLIEVASKIVLIENSLMFCVEGRFYTLSKTGSVLTLTVLNTQTETTLSPAPAA